MDLLDNMAAVELASTSLFSDANLVSYYKLENVNDSKASNNLTNNNTVTFPAGLFNNAGSFNGSNQSLTFATGSTFFTGTSDKSFSTWIKPSSQPSSGVTGCFLSWGNATHRFIFSYKNLSSVLNIGISDGNTEKDYVQTLANGIWANLIFSYASSGPTLTTYLNGVLLGVHTPQITSAANGFSIGNQQTENSNFFPGLIDDTALFSRVLTQSDVNIINGIGGHVLTPSSKYW